MTPRGRNGEGSFSIAQNEYAALMTGLAIGALAPLRCRKTGQKSLRGLPSKPKQPVLKSVGDRKLSSADEISRSSNALRGVGGARARAASLSNASSYFNSVQTDPTTSGGASWDGARRNECNKAVTHLEKECLGINVRVNAQGEGVLESDAAWIAGTDERKQRNGRIPRGGKSAKNGRLSTDAGSGRVQGGRSYARVGGA